MFARFLNRSTVHRDTRRVPRRAILRLEGLEGRLVMTSATHLGSPFLMNAIPVGSSLAHTPPIVELTTIKASTPPTTGVSFYIGQPGPIYIHSDGAGDMIVEDVAVGLNYQFPKASIRSVSIFVQQPSATSLSSINIDDSDGMPFAPGTSIDLNGTGQIVLNLGGSRTVSGNETYVAGGAPWTPGTISLDNNITFTLHSCITLVGDSIPITGNLDVQTSGTSVQLNSYGPGYSQYLSGMGVGGGDYLAYSNKPTVTLETYAPNAGVFLDAPDAAVGESNFMVNMHAAGENTTIDSTPKNVQTVVNVDPPDANATVALWGNFGPVIIDGDSTTAVAVGFPLNSTGPITQGIEADVWVEGASSLVVNDHGNVTTAENVTVTDQSISGSGLFGNSGVTLYYGGVQGIDILAGQMADAYTVKPSSSNAVFTSSLWIDSISNWDFRVNVSVNSASDLNLTLVNENAYHNPTEAWASVLDVTSEGSVDLPGTHPNGTIDVFFGHGATSRISYGGFENVYSR